MGDNTVEQISAAIVTVTTPTTLEEVRQSTQQALDAFKENTRECIGYVPALLQSGNSSVRFYAVQLLEHAARYAWSHLTPPERGDLKSLATCVAQNFPDDEAKWVQEKLVSTLVEIAKHEWPQRFGDLLPGLFDMAATADVHTLTALLLCRSLSDLISDISKLRKDSTTIDSQNANLSKERRKQLVDGYTEALPHVLRFVGMCITGKAEAYQAAPRESPAWKRQHAILKAALEALTSLFDWAPLNLVAADSSVLTAAIPMLEDPALKNDVLDMTLSLLARKATPQSTHITPILGFSSLFFEVLQNPPGRMGPLDDDAHRFQLRVVEALCGMGTLHLRANLRTPRKGEGGADVAEPLHFNPEFLAFLQNMLTVCSYPSLRMQSYCLTLWTELLTQKSKGVGDMGPLFEQLLYITLSMASPLNPFLGPEEARDVARLDFDNPEDAVAYLANHQKRAVELMRMLTRRDAPAAFAFVCQYMEHALTAAAAADPNPAFQCSKDAEEWRALDAAGALMGACLGAMRPDTLRDDGSRGAEGPVAQAAAALEAELGFGQQLQNPMFIERHLNLLTQFSPFLRYHKTMVPAVVSHIFHFTTFRLADEAATPVSHLSPITVSVRDQAGHALNNVALTVRGAVQSSVEEQWARVKELVTQGALRSPERLHLYKFLLICANQTQSDELQRSLVNDMLGPLIRDWCSADLYNVLSNVETFAGNLGLFNSPSGPGALFTDMQLEFRDMLFHVVSLLYVIGKWSASWKSQALTPHLESLLHPLLGLIRTLHTVTTPEVMSRMPEPMLHVFRPYREEDETQLEAAAFQPSAHLSWPDQIRLLQWTLAAMRNRAYSMLGFLMKIRDFFSPDINAHLISSAFHNLETMPTHAFRDLLAQVIMPFRRLCPSELQTSLVEPLLVPWVSFLRDRLSQEWGMAQQRPNTGEEVEEVIQDNALAMLTIEFAKFLRLLAVNVQGKSGVSAASKKVTFARGGGAAGGRGGGGGGGRGAHHQEGSHVLLSEPMSSIFVSSALCCIDWPVPSASSVGITLCSLILPVFKNSPEFLKGVADEMIPVLLRALTKVDEAESAGPILDLIRDAYTEVLRHNDQWAHESLATVPSVEATDLRALDQALKGGSGQKVKREAFSHVFSRLIGANVQAKLFKRDVEEIGEVKEEDKEAEVIMEAEAAVEMDARPICRKFRKGHCKKGDKCDKRHVA